MSDTGDMEAKFHNRDIIQGGNTSHLRAGGKDDFTDLGIMSSALGIFLGEGREGRHSKKREKSI